MADDATDVMRDRQINIRLTEAEVALLGKLAERYETNTASVIRKLLRDAESTLNSGWRWHHVKDEARRMAEEAEIPGLRMWFDDEWRVVYLDDGVDGISIPGGNSAYFELARWPGSKLMPRMAHRRRFPETVNGRVNFKSPPAFETLKVPKKK